MRRILWLLVGPLPLLLLNCTDLIGHVDAGKSTLMGRLLYDLKVVDQRTIDRYRKEAEKIGKSSFALAWVLDQGSEERSRGVTIDIATNKFETEKTAFTILDAPGHRDFIPNMIAGAAQADFAVLVIDASTGSFESGLKGQTKEHAQLVRSMGVQRLIICVNKLDTVSWSQDRFLEIKHQVSAFLTSIGFQEKNIAFIPCSGLLGDNIARRSTEGEAAWYKGPTLVDELDKSEPISRALTKPLRLTIADIFRGGVQNPISISGRIEAGSLQVGDALLIQPANLKCYIKGLEIDNENEPADWAVAGQNVIVHLSGIEEQYLKVGDVLSSPSSSIENVKTFTAKVLAFEFLTPMGVDVHRGRLNVAGRIREILGVVDKNTGSGGGTGKKKVRIVKPGVVARVVVELEREVPLESGARVVLRCGGETVAAGLLE
jgi:elongation factor 1 alpha-like protein